MRITPNIAVASVILAASALPLRASDPVVEHVPDAVGPATLKKVDDCTALETNIRERTVAQWAGIVDQAREAQFAYRADVRAHPGCGGVYGCASSPSAKQGAEAAPADGAQSHSDTNVQVPGVDEADFVKTDGSYFYLLGTKGFTVADAWPPEQAHVLSRLELSGEPLELFVAGDRAVIFKQARKSYDYGCSYGYYGCDYADTGNDLDILVVDVQDRAAPKILRQTTITASYVDARRIGNAVHTLVTFRPRGLSLEVTAYGAFGYYRYGGSDDEVNAEYEATKERNAAKIASAPLGALVPSISDTFYGANTHILQSETKAVCGNVFLTPEPDAADVLSLLSFDLTADAAVTTTSVVGKAGPVYASTDAFYVAASQERGYARYWYSDDPEVTELSTVHKFRFNDAGASYVASGTVKGRVLNQFAMDERDGYLRVAATSGHAPMQGAHSTLSVLAEKDGTLALQGQVDHIAPSEDIRSVRFDGDRGFVVTFKKTDPLYAFDLSNPSAPRIAGELKLPGFSTYMHMLDATHLLTIGYDAEDKGDFAYFQGMLIQIFDVTDMANPSLVHKHAIGSRGTSSEALSNHLAFNFDRATGRLALPMTICKGGDGKNGQYGDQMTFSGLIVFDVSVEQGINEHGRMPFSAANDDNPYGAPTCYNWWSNASSTVQRSIFMDDYVAALSSSTLHYSRLSTLDTTLSTIEF